MFHAREAQADALCARVEILQQIPRDLAGMARRRDMGVAARLFEMACMETAETAGHLRGDDIPPPKVRPARIS